VAIGLALLAALVYGAADFFGGIASRKTPAAAVVVLSQLAGVALLFAILPFVPSHFYASDMGWGLLAGLCGAAGIGLLYAALAIGRMGVVSPVTAVVAASVPVFWGLASGERPSSLALAGVALAFLAVGLVSTNVETLRFSLREPGVGLALGSGIAIGFLYVLLAHTHRDAGLSVLVASRAASIPALLLFALVRREPLRPAAGALGIIVLAGLLDMGANIFYVLAAREGLLTVVAVLTSLYPAATVFLALFILRERLGPVQWAGVVFAICGVTLIAL
jgi:drug/metabolite transporter (DMT)-like permease